MNNKTEQSKGYAFVSATKHVGNELLRVNEVKFYVSQIKLMRRIPQKGRLLLFLNQLKISH